MTLTPEQKATVSNWIASGDNISAVQKKLRDQFSLSLTYKDVRFLVDDLDLTVKDPAPKPSSDLSQPTPAARAPAGPAAARTGDGSAPAAAPGAEELEPLDEDPADFAEHAHAPAPDAGSLPDDAPAGPSNVTVEVDKVTLHPGALASGTVTFSDGVTGKWIVDNYGRPGFTEVSQPGYRPKPDDAQAFMQELSLQLQKRGF